MKLQAWTARTIAGALLVGLFVTPLQAQRAHIGAHGGYNFDRDRGLAGAQMLLPIAPPSSCIRRSIITSRAEGRSSPSAAT